MSQWCLWYVILRKAQLVARELSTQIVAHVPGQRQGKCAYLCIRMVKERTKYCHLTLDPGIDWVMRDFGCMLVLLAVRSRGLEL
jgi:hypothetical protein